MCSAELQQIYVPAEWRTVDQEAARTHLHPATLRRAINTGKLRHARVSGRQAIRLKPEWTDRWLLETTTPTEQRR